MTKDEIKHHLTQYSYYRYVEREPGKYLPLLNMVKSMLYSLPKRAPCALSAILLAQRKTTLPTHCIVKELQSTEWKNVRFRN